MVSPFAFEANAPYNTNQRLKYIILFIQKQKT